MCPQEVSRYLMTVSQSIPEAYQKAQNLIHTLGGKLGNSSNEDLGLLSVDLPDNSKVAELLKSDLFSKVEENKVIKIGDNNTFKVEPINLEDYNHNLKSNNTKNNKEDEKLASLNNNGEL